MSQQDRRFGANIAWISSSVVAALVGVLGLFVSPIMAIIAFAFAGGVAVFHFTSPRSQLQGAKRAAARAIDREDYEAALAHLKRAESRLPADLGVKTSLALVLKKLGRGGEAEGVWEQIWNRQKSPYAAYYYAKTLRENGKSREAARVLDASAPREGLEANYYNLLGCCYMDIDEANRAVAAFRRGPLERWDDPDVELVALRYNLARALEAIGERAQALTHYRAIRSARSSYEDIEARIAELERAT